jgi:DNA-binding response OmpR family regulator
MLSGGRILLCGAAGERGPIVARLAAEGCAVACMPVADAEAILRSEADVLVLDGGDSPADVAGLCARLRGAAMATPVLVILDKDGDEDADRGGAGVVACLDAGANDCVVRPLRWRELAARLRALLRLGTGAAVLRVGPFLFHPGRRMLEPDEGGAPVRLTATEAAMLKFLCRAGGQPVPRPALLHHVWGYSPGVSTHTVETHMYRLRRKIEPEPGRFRLLVSDEAGYRINTGWQRAAE